MMATADDSDTSAVFFLFERQLGELGEHLFEKVYFCMLKIVIKVT